VAVYNAEQTDQVPTTTPGAPPYTPSYETQVNTIKYAPFKRGIMRFEDYNYNMYNQFILIDSVKGAKMQQFGGYQSMNKQVENAIETGPRLTESELK